MGTFRQELLDGSANLGGGSNLAEDTSCAELLYGAANHRLIAQLEHWQDHKRQVVGERQHRRAVASVPDNQ